MASTVLDTTPQQQQTWVPYQPSKDCSQGFCSIYCPQWCYIVFSPPPPVDFSDSSSSPTFSPLVIAIIGILASAFLLITYYTIISKYCGSFDSLRRRSSSGSGVDHELQQDSTAWQAGVGSEGLDEAVIKSITVRKYRKEDGFVDGTDCSVCLAEFQEDERLRLLPKCSHAFHVTCIDTWLKSHSNCPLCRASVVVVVLPPPPSSESEPARLPRDSSVIRLEDLESGGIRDGGMLSGGPPKGPPRVVLDGHGVMEDGMTNPPPPPPPPNPVLISDVLEMMDSPRVGSGAGSSSQSPQEVLDKEGEGEGGGRGRGRGRGRGKNSTILSNIKSTDHLQMGGFDSKRMVIKGNTSSILPM